MKDYIKTREAIMFAGTRLRVLLEGENSVDCEKDVDSVFMNGELRARFTGDYIPRPLVRPLSSLKDAELLDIYKKCRGLSISDMKDLSIFRRETINIINILRPDHTEGTHILFSFDFEKELKVFSEYSFNPSVFNNEAAKYHVDIFNWLGRGLAAIRL